jgi:hypothetical protein
VRTGPTDGINAFFAAVILALIASQLLVVLPYEKPFAAKYLPHNQMQKENVRLNLGPNV